jgi:hypothetical protein
MYKKSRKCKIARRYNSIGTWGSIGIAVYGGMTAPNIHRVCGKSLTIIPTTCMNELGGTRLQRPVHLKPALSRLGNNSQASCGRTLQSAYGATGKPTAGLSSRPIRLSKYSLELRKLNVHATEGTYNRSQNLLPWIKETGREEAQVAKRKHIRSLRGRDLHFLTVLGNCNSFASGSRNSGLQPACINYWLNQPGCAMIRHSTIHSEE